MLSEWLKDIRQNQLSSIIGGVGPVHCLVEVFAGVRDLFWIPIQEYRQDGYFVRGMQRGVESFAVSTAAATLELAQRMAWTIQGVSEFAFEIVNPNYPRPPAITWPMAQPASTWDGFTMAYRTLRTGISEVGETLHLATQEERARGNTAVRGLLRMVPSATIKPFALLGQAAGQVLGGVRNQIKPGIRREEEEKWRTNE